MIGTRLALVAAVVVGGLSGCNAGIESAERECAELDGGIGEMLNQQAILEARPDGATKVNDSFWGCDPNGFSSAGRTYRSDITRSDLLEFYSRAVEDDGWREHTEKVNSDACFTKDIRNVNVYLTVRFPSDHDDLPGLPERSPDEYIVELEAASGDYDVC